MIFSFYFVNKKERFVRMKLMVQNERLGIIYRETYEVGLETESCAGCWRP